MFLTFLQSSIRFSAIFLFGSVGETLTEKSGNLNLGIPGIMCMGGAGGVVGAVAYLKTLSDLSQMNAFAAVIIPMIMAMLFALLGGLIYSVLTISLRCNQNVTGLALTTFGTGVLSFVGGVIGSSYSAGMSAISKLFKQSFPCAADLGWFGQIFLSYGALVYIAIIVAFIAAIVIRKTRIGLNLRAVGENPATADAAGVSVTNYKYAATMIGSMIAGLGGLFYILDYRNGNIEYTIDAYGWLAVALVIFTVWRPNWAILGSIIFSMLYFMPDYIQGVSFAQKEVIKMVPYLVTIVVLVITSIVSKKESQPPASLGVTYFREER